MWKGIQWRDLILPLSGWCWPVGWGAYTLQGRILGQLLAIGDSANPKPPPHLLLAGTILNLPTLYLGAVGQWLVPYLTPFGVLELCACINAVVWARAVQRLLRLP
jgi:hypothetical protein